MRTGTPPSKSRKQRQRERQQERDTALREAALRDQADRARLRQLEDQRQRDMQELRMGAQLGPEAARLAQAIEQAEHDMQELRERMARRVERLTPARRARFERMREIVAAEEAAKKAQRRRKLTPEERAERRRKALAAMQYTAQLAIQRNNERRAAMTPEQREREAQRAEEARQAIERYQHRQRSDREYYRQSLKHATALRREQRKREHEEAMAAAIRVRDAERHYHAVRDALPRPPSPEEIAAQARLAAEKEERKAAKAFAREYFALVRKTEREQARAEAQAQAQAQGPTPRKTTDELVQEIAFTVPASMPLSWIGIVLCRYLKATLVPEQPDDFQLLTGYRMFALRPPYGLFAALPADESPFAGHHVAFFPDGKVANITAWLERALPRVQAARAHLARLHSARTPDGRVAWRLSWADYPPHGKRKRKRDVDTATPVWQAPAWAIGIAQPLHEAVLRGLYAGTGLYDLHRGVTLDVPPGPRPNGTVKLHGEPVAHVRGIGNDAIVTPVIPIPAASPRGKTPSDVLEALGVDVALLTEQKNSATTC